MSWGSLRIRIAAVIVVLTIILGLGGTLRARADLARIAQTELEKRGVTIARDLAVQHADQILVNDIYVLYTLANDFLLNNSDLRYIVILDSKGQVMVSNFPQGLPPGLHEANVPAADEDYRVRRLPTSEGVVYDIAMHVAGKRASVVRVGMMEEPVWSEVNQQTLGLLTLTVAITLLGAGAGYVLGTILTRPLSELVRITQAVAQGDLQRKAPVKGGNEVEELARAFNHMTGALATSRDELVERNEELAGLNAIAAAVGRSLEMEAILDAALCTVLELMRLPGGWVFVSEDGTGRLALAAQRGVPEDLFITDNDAITERCVCQQTLRSGRAQVVERIEDCPRLNGLRPKGRSACHLCVPLRSGERVLGLMNLVCTADEGYGSHESLRHLTAVGHHIGIAMENARLYRELQRKEALRGQLVRKLISAQEEERRRIARELHDQYAQGLTALSMGIEATERVLSEDQAHLKAQLDRVKTLTARNLDQTYDLIFDLRPTTLDDLGLAPAVRWYAESRLQPLGVAIQLETGTLRERLPAEIETASYRVIQEALLNVAKHAQARQVVIRLAVHDCWLRGTVEDDGQGFDLEATQRSGAVGCGLGLLGMRERVELLGGSLQIESAPGRGTRLEMDVPIGEAHGTEGSSPD